MSVTIKEVTQPLQIAEGPHWDSRARALYFVNVTESTIHKYDPATGLTTSTKLGGEPSFIVPVEGTTDQFVVAMERKFLVLQWDGRDGSPAKVLKELGEVAEKTRINDGKVDPRGRLFAGTLAINLEKNAGSLYRLDGAKMTKMETGITLANGLSWDSNEKAFYYIDSLENNIRRYDYDVETGEISNLRYIFDLEKNGVEGFPDGHTIDTDGNLWVAVFGGSCVAQVDPRSGKLLRKVPLPALQITSCTFGGPNLDILYVTSASHKIGPKEFDAGENLLKRLSDSGDRRLGGGIFAVTGLGVRGHTNRNFKL